MLKLIKNIWDHIYSFDEGVLGPSAKAPRTEIMQNQKGKKEKKNLNETTVYMKTPCRREECEVEENNDGKRLITDPSNFSFMSRER